MKKIISILLIIVMILLTSCNVSESIKLDKRKKRERDKITKNVIECINNKDCENLKKMFCKKYQEDEKLEEDIYELFDYFDEEIVSYEDDGTYGTSETVVSDGKIVLDYDSTYVKNVTLGNKKYSLSIDITWVDKDDEDMEGVTGIGIRDKNKAIIFYI